METAEELCLNYTKFGLKRECEKLGLLAVGSKMEIAEKIVSFRKNTGGTNDDPLSNQNRANRDAVNDGVCAKDDAHTHNDENDEREGVGVPEKEDSHADNDEREDGGSSTYDEDDDDDDVYEEEDSDVMYRTAIKGGTSTPKKNGTTCTTTNEDMEESIESFGAEDGEDVSIWLAQLKSVCKSARWDDEQQLIMCRKKLVGTARRFVFSLRDSVGSFKKLEKALIKEFAPRIRASDVHRALTNRKKKTTESMRDYIYEMQRLALPIDLDEPSLCEYIVNGITDDEHHQSLLYEAQTIERLKEKLLNFEKVTKSSKSKTKREDIGSKREKTRKDDKGNNKVNQKRSCYNCGESSHVSAECPQKNDGPKCFSCNTFGHRARDCTKGGAGNRNGKEKVMMCGTSEEQKHCTQPSSSAIDLENGRIMEERCAKRTGSQGTIIPMKIGPVVLNTLFDTGSPRNLITYCSYEKIGKPVLSSTNMKFRGFGGNEIEAQGIFIVDVCIDHNLYCDVVFYVVPNVSMPFEAVLGTASLEHFDVKVTTNGVQILKREECEIMGIVSSEKEFDVPALPTELQGEIIRRAHENGHFGVRKLEDVINRDYYIPSLAEKIRKKIECCVICVLADRKRGKVDGMLFPIEKGEVPFDTYHVHHMGPMEATDKMYKYIFVVVDAFTKYTWIYPTKTTASNEVIQRLKTQSDWFGNPRRIYNPGRKTATNFLGPYKVVEVMPKDRYRVHKINGEGPQHTKTASSHMKRYKVELDPE
uniref:RNA-directed DNA polymerase n=1 Tax=Anopheles minimus TaxID=112268 RepID=A0A182W804_9DIPT